ncbi:MAG TPA: hypothetical protein DEV93_20805 [Chloroflexi bacterium]|nr:hypothetical protein [Chloroflexota bacterium]
MLAMDLYVRRGLPDASDPEVIALSALLNRLRMDEDQSSSHTLRNPNGVHLKLCNFRAKDRPGHGMSHGNHLEHDVWDRFAKRSDDLSRAAKDIRRRVVSSASRETLDHAVVDMRRTGRDESMSSLSGPHAGDPKRASDLAMTLIRDTADLASAIYAGDPKFRAQATLDEFRGRLDGLSALLRQVRQELVGEAANQIPSPMESTSLDGRHDEPDQARGIDSHKLVIFPCADAGSVKHFNRTVRSPVDLTALGLNLDQLSEVLPANYVISRARVWGVMPRRTGLNETRFKQCAADDIALFTGGKQVFSGAIIRAKLRSPELARALWHTNALGSTWELVFLLSEPVEVQVPYEVLSKILGYSSKFAFRAFSILSEDASERVRKALDPAIGQLWA